MSNTFEFVGKIYPCKETNNFKPYEQKTFDSGWTKKSLKFNAVCGTNRHLIETSVLVPKKLEEMNIYTIAQYEGEEKAHKEVISYSERLDPEKVAAVSAFKKYVIDTELPNRRAQLKEAISKFEDDSIDEETMTKLGVTDLESCKEAYEKSCKKRHEFIWEGDFLDYLKKLLSNDKIKDMKWLIKGEYALEYSSQNDQWYRKFKAQRIYRAADDAEAKSQASFIVSFDKNAIDDSDYEETKKLRITGYISQYLGKPYNKNCYAPMFFTVDGSKDEMAEKRAKFFKEKFTFPSESVAEVREYGIVCDILDGAQAVEFTEDMLSDDEREAIELGFETFESIKRDHSKAIYGDKVTDIVIVKPYGDYKASGAVETVLTTADLSKPHSELDDEVEDVDEVADIFDVDDDDDEI